MAASSSAGGDTSSPPQEGGGVGLEQVHLQEQGEASGSGFLANEENRESLDLDPSTRVRLGEAEKELLTLEDTTVRRWQCLIKDIQVSNLKGINTPYIRFTVGGDFRVEDNRHKGGKIEKKGKRGPTFRTHVLKNPGGGGNYRTSWKKKCNRSYEDLETQDLLVEIWHRRLFCPNQRKGEARIKLLDIASGYVQQTVDCYAPKGDKKRVGSVSFSIVFQEEHLFKLSFDDWTGKEIVPVDHVGTDLASSDPYVKMKIRRDWWKFFRKGGFRGRSLVSDHCLKTVEPRWDTLGSIFYYGTIAELDNEDVDVEVWDWNATRDVLIGKRRLPLRGMIETQGLYCRLLHETSRGIRKKGGSIQGNVNIETCPRYMQQGDFYELKPWHTYLCVEIKGCQNLKEMDESLYSDPFVVVRYDGMSYRTKTVKENLNPIFDEFIYIPILFVDFTPEEFREKGHIEINVYDEDQDGNDLLGVCHLSVSKILNSPKSNFRERKGERTRRWSGQLPLENAFLKNHRQTITFDAYFVPDLGPLVQWEDDEEHLQDVEISPVIMEREAEWREELRFEGKDPSPVTYPSFRRDEKLKERFLPSYLQVPDLSIPRDTRSEKLIMRMVHCMTWDTDESIYHGFEDVWTTPEFFQAVKKGDSEDHAILMCNLFLGLEKYHGTEAYLCLGETTEGDEHTWVMTREADGTVVFWETTNGKSYVLPSRWAGVPPPPEENPEGNAPDGQVGAASGTGLSDLEEGVEAGEASRKTVTEADLLLVPGDTYLDPEEIFRDQLEDDDPLVGRSSMVRVSKRRPLLEMALREADVEIFDSMPHQPLPYSRLFVVFNNMNLWANLGQANPGYIRYDFSDRSQWLPFVPEDPRYFELRGSIQPFYREVPLQPKFPLYKIRAVENEILREMKLAYAVWRQKNHMQTKFLNTLTPLLKRGCSILEKRLVASDDDSITQELADMQARLNTLREGTPDETKAQRTQRLDEMETLKKRMRRIRSRIQGQDYDSWRGTLMEELPVGHDFVGVPINFSYYDAVRIRKWIMDKYPYHADDCVDSKFAFGVHAEPYRNQVLSVWVFLCKVTPVPEGEEQFESPSQPEDST